MKKIFFGLWLFFSFFVPFAKKPVFAQDNFASPYGLDVEGTFCHQVREINMHPVEGYDNLAQLIYQSGARWIRFRLKWPELQRTNADSWDEERWNCLTKLIAAFKNKGLLIYLTIADTAVWASSAPAGVDNPEDYPPQNIADYDQFLRKLTQKIEQAGLKIDSWEIENEIDGAGHRGFNDHPEKYVEMYDRANQILRGNTSIHENSRPFITPAGFFNIVNNARNVRYWLTNLNKNQIDALDFHIYNYNESNQYLNFFRDFKNLRNQAGLTDKPIWIGETNFNATTNGCLDPQAPSKIPERYRAFLNNGATKVFWAHHWDSWWGPSILQLVGWRDYPRYVTHPDVYRAFQQMALPPTEIALIPNPECLSFTYENLPSNFTVRAGEPVKIRIKARGTGIRDLQFFDNSKFDCNQANIRQALGFWQGAKACTNQTNCEEVYDWIPSQPGTYQLKAIAANNDYGAATCYPSAGQPASIRVIASSLTLTPSPTPTATIPPCPSRNLGNLDCDSQGKINETDLNLLLSKWGQPDFDLNGDRIVNETDLSILLSSWRP